MYTLGQIIKSLDRLAPSYLAEKWDNVGLLIGSRKQTTNKVLCTLDINLEVIHEAIKENVECIISHHPFIFKGITTIDFDTPKGEMIKLLIQHNIAVYSMHTNWDIAKGGINDIIAEAFEIKESRILETTREEKLCKLVVYAPRECEDALRSVITQYNSCTIGNYKGCTFVTEGIGSFVPMEGSQPYIGEEGKCEKVKEIKIECMIFKKELEKILERIEEIHPYEEIAYDVYTLEHLQSYEGIGRYGQIKEISLNELVEKVKTIFSVPYVRVVGNRKEAIKYLAICSGSGSEYINQATKVADVYITGDVKFHEGQIALEKGLTIIDVGHYASENIAIPYLKKYLEQEYANLEVICSKIDGEVFRVI